MSEDVKEVGRKFIVFLQSRDIPIDDGVLDAMSTFGMGMYAIGWEDKTKEVLDAFSKSGLMPKGKE